MVQRTKEALQREADLLFVVNTQGEIEADEVLSLATDILDSVEFPTASGVLAPVIMSFSIQNQTTDVDPGFDLAASPITFLFNVSHSDNVEGNLTINQTGEGDLSTTVDPKNTSIVLTPGAVNNLIAGNSITFTLSGTATSGAGGGAISRTFIITARELDDYVYIGEDADGVPTVPIPGITSFANPFKAGSQNITIPTFVGNQHVIISQKASEPAITQILLGGVDQRNTFTVTDDAYQANGANYDAYVSDNPLVGSILSGATLTLVRG